MRRSRTPAAARSSPGSCRPGRAPVHRNSGATRKTFVVPDDFNDPMPDDWLNLFYKRECSSTRMPSFGPTQPRAAWPVPRADPRPRKAAPALGGHVVGDRNRVGDRLAALAGTPCAARIRPSPPAHRDDTPSRAVPCARRRRPPVPPPRSVGSPAHRFSSWAAPGTGSDWRWPLTTGRLPGRCLTGYLLRRAAR